MSDHFDTLETRDPAQREREQFARLPDIVANAMRAPGWAKHLAGIDPQAITSRAALAKLPLLRKSDLPALQKEMPPFGGFNVIAPGKARRLMMSPGPIFEPEGQSEDWPAPRARSFAAGVRAGDIVHNAFSYHLTPGGWMLEAGAHALGCAVIPGGVGNTEQQVDAIAHLRATAYTGTPDFLKILLDTAEKSGKDVSSLKRGLVSGAALPASLREELGRTRRRGAAVLCHRRDWRHRLRERRARRHGGERESARRDRAARHRRSGARRRGRRSGGHHLQSRLPDDPARHRRSLGGLPGVSPCGRTNMRIRGWMGRADQTTKIKGMFVRPEQVAEIARRHPELGRVRLTVTRAGEQDAMTLMAECANAGACARRRDRRNACGGDQAAR